jgi:hypothetical protein
MEILLFVSVIMVFSAPMIQLFLIDLGMSINTARLVSISILIVFTGVLYVSLKKASKSSETGSREK